MLPVLLLVIASCGEATDLTVLGHLTTVTQSSPWMNFSLGVQNAPYILVELWMHVISSPLALMASSETVPNISIDGFIADVLDESGWSLNKTYHHLLLPGDKNWTLAVYSTAPTVSYNIQVSPSAEPMCPRNCSENGVCLNGVCQCSEHFIDEDCSLFTSHLVLDNHIVIPTPSNTWCFLSIEDTDGSLDLFVAVTPSTSLAHVYLRCAEPSPAPKLPATPYHNIDFMQFSETNETEQLFAVPCKNGLISMHNEGEKTIMLTYEIHKAMKKPKNNVLYIIIAVVAVITLSWVCAYAASSSVYRRAVSLAQTDVGTGLATEIVDTMFPVVQFAGDLKDPDCAICMGVFVPGTEVRVLPCAHVFHAMCLDRWFALHTVNPMQFCCTCKFDCAIQQSVLEESDTNAIEEAP